MIVVVDADVATHRASCPVPDPIRKYVPTGMFAIPPDATVHELVPAVAADADAVASAAPADQFDDAYRLLGAAGSLICAFGGNGSPVFGVVADKPMNRVCDGEMFWMMHDGFTPVPVGATYT